ncbi:MAG: cupredoxin domain-containing protein [Bdellovibrionaceae bacterium]|nr:cupredoxin domain-containing protein [Pseudobdellovibrionaceae bacterium]
MKLFILLSMMLTTYSAFADWKIDLSRRQKDLQRLEQDSLFAKEKNLNPLEQIFEKEEPKEEVVIANTNHGFVPQTLRLRKDHVYQVTVVNVNKDKKNVSFMLDAFSEHHGTFFGDEVTFTVRPQKEGTYSYYCPEAEFTGKVLVYNPDENLQPVPPVQMRQPAQTNSELPVSIRGMDE